MPKSKKRGITAVTKTRIIVEIPHRGQCTTWVAFNDQEIINQSGVHYREWTLDDDLDFDVPETLLNILQAEGRAIEVSYGDTVEWYAPDEAPTELEAAKEALFHDLHSGYILRVKEAKAFNASMEAKLAIDESLEECGLLYIRNEMAGEDNEKF